MCNKKSIFADLAHCIKPSVAQKLDMVILHARRNNLRSDQRYQGSPIESSSWQEYIE